MVENLEAERLTLGVSSKVGFEAERVDCWYESLYRVQRRAGHGRVLGHVSWSNKNNFKLKPKRVHCFS